MPAAEPGLICALHRYLPDQATYTYTYTYTCSIKVIVRTRVMDAGGTGRLSQAQAQARAIWQAETTACAPIAALSVSALHCNLDCYSLCTSRWCIIRHRAWYMPE